MYSFGVVVWEVLTGEEPWAGLTIGQMVTRVVVRGERLPLREAAEGSVLACVVILTRACFGAAEARPSFEALCTELRALLVRQRREEQLLPREAPESFLCPVSMELMRDPVMVCDGFSYERGNIEAWLAAHRTSPMTGLPLSSTALTPHIALRHAIESFTSS